MFSKQIKKELSLGIRCSKYQKTAYHANECVFVEWVNSQMTLQFLNNLKIMFRILKQNVGRES